jgi:hypothetical protein
MVFQTLASLAWLAVIVLQAFMPFVWGPRHSSIEDETDSAGHSSHTTTKATTSSARTTTSVSKNKDTNTAKNFQTGQDYDQSVDDVSLSFESKVTFASSSDEVVAVDPDERDSIDEGFRQMQKSCRTEPPSTSKDFNRNDRGAPQTTVPASLNALGSLDVSNKENPILESRECNVPPSSQHDSTDDCIDEDEEWRYQLIKDYYSTSSQSINTTLFGSISNIDDLDEGEDPALQPIRTINTLGEKLNQQRALTKLNYAAQQSTRNSSFDHSSSVIASY